MKNLKKLLKAFTYWLISLLIFALLINTLNYLSIINYKTLQILKIILSLISIFIGGFIIGKNSVKKGWIEGLKFGILITIIFLLISLVLKSLALDKIIYIILIIIVSIFGSVIGINKKH